MDLAALGFAINSDPLVKATGDLDKFGAAAAKAAGAASKLGGGSIAKLVAEVQSANSKLSAIVGTLEKIASANRGMAAANDNLAKSSAGVAAAQAKVATEAARAGQAIGVADSHVNAYREHLSGLASASAAAAAGVRRTTAAAADSAGAMKANVGNLAAQFQDVAVTAAAGMSPMMIALQQGTQLAGVFAQTGGSALKSLGAAFLSVVSPVSLLTIGIVALAAAGLQMVNWSKLAQSSLNALADAMVTAAPYAVGLGAVLTLAFAPQILTAIGSITLAIGRGLVAAITAATQAMIAFAIANPFAAFVLGTAAAVAAIVAVGKAFGKDFVTPIRNGINFVVGGFVGAFDAIRKTWRMLPSAIGDSVIQTANSVIRAVDGMVNKAIASLNGLTSKVPGGSALQIGYRANSGQIANPNAGAAQRVNDIARESIAAAQRVDYVGKAIAGVNALATSGAAKLREWAKSLAGAPAKTGGKAAQDAAAAQPKTDKWADLITDADRQHRSLEQAGAQIGVYGQDLARLRHEQELLNKAQDAGLKNLTVAQRQELAARAAKMAATEYANTRRTAAEETTRAHAEAMRQLEVERGAIGLAGEALAAYQYKQQAINRELAAGVALKDIDTGKIAEQAQAYAQAAAANEASRKAIEDQRAALEANRQAATAFFQDWIGGIRQGENVFKAFGNAVTRALNSIIDKLIEAAIQQLFFNSLASASGGGGAAGAASNIISLVSSLFANGGAFGTAQRFANGGTFTNSIVTDPTLFRFAKGSKMGLMGEQGPEAIMPLARGPNGKLGVQANGGSGRPSIRMGDVHMHNSLAGAIGADGLATALRQSGEATLAQVKRELQNMLAQLDQDGTMIG